ncbi:uncharacterized protein LOC141651853 [Silene latifolia]|uniref:uncharacterized protein LOC141651853 n=1 Tax=Silene latifolia TaxID=37657 RepID=UPI003D787812
MANALPVGSEFLKRNLNWRSFCSLCDGLSPCVETISHLFRDCSFVKAIWNRRPWPMGDFNSILGDIQCMNEVVCNKDASLPQAPLLDFSPELELSKRIRNSFPSWIVGGPVCKNICTSKCDAAWRADKSSGMGWCLLDGNGTLRNTSHARSFASSALHAEGHAAIMALKWALNEGYLHVRLVTDCLTLVMQVAGAEKAIASINCIIQDFKSIAPRFHCYSLSFYPRGVNRIAHNLAQEALLLSSFKEGEGGPVIEDTEPINVGTELEPKELRIGTTLSSTERADFIDLLNEFKDVFAWSYKDMPGIDRDIAEHRIPIKPGFKPVKQKLRRMRTEWALKIKEEVDKQFKAGFIKVSEYSDWVANIVPVPKKDGRIRVCVDFRDLNKASPKDDFPLPHIDILVDNTADHALLSFMDGYAGYNQIKMAMEDMHKTAFVTQWGTYCYTVMPFGLINAGATYQRTATTLLHDMMHKEVEVYVDDMIVKSKEREGHIANLRKFFARLRKYNMRLNPQKCTFGVTSGKLLGYVVSQRGIEIDPSKIKALIEMPQPQTEKEVRGFLGKVQYISRFISKLTMICEPIFKKLKKTDHTMWDDDCQKAFDRIKEILAKPPVLMPPQQDQPLGLYLTVTETAMGAMLAQTVGSEERAIYYLSKKFLEYECKYSQLEKTCLALVWATKKLRHYMLSYSVKIFSKMDPVKYLFEKPVLNGRLARWTMMLSEFDLKYVPLKVIKGRAVAEFFAENPINDAQTIDTWSFPDEDILQTDVDSWDLYFDGASNLRGFGIGVLLISPEGEHTPIAVKLDFEVTNNAAEYEACLIGLQAAVSLGIKNLRVHGDSSLIINQVTGSWKIRSESLAPYQARIDQVAQFFDHVTYLHLPREENQFADALAKLASLINMPDYMMEMPLCIERRSEPAYDFLPYNLTKSRQIGIFSTISLPLTKAL